MAEGQEYVTWDVFSERRQAIDGRFKELDRRMGEVERRINWLIGLALISIGMLALDLFMKVAN